MATVCALALTGCSAALGPTSPGGPTRSGWGVVAAAIPGGEGALASVACPSRTSCVAVGYSGGSALPAALVEDWNGSAWSMRAAATPGVESWLNAVACVAPGSCVAVGGYSTSSDNDEPGNHTLVEMEVGGSWRMIPSPSPGTGDQTELDSVACTSITSCVAVGSLGAVSDPYEAQVLTLVELWNGIGWSVIPSPSPGTGRQAALQSVACPSPKQCFAVGYESSATSGGFLLDFALVKSWRGVSWSVVPDPGPVPPHRSVLQSIACPAPNRCVAVGFQSSTRDPYQPDATLADVWSGSTWSTSTSRNPAGEEESTLQAVACPAATSCVAVGFSGTPGSAERSLVEWSLRDGWIATFGPATSSQVELAAVACPSPSVCLTVGKRGAGTNPAWQPLVATWGGDP